jgi:hypothetical protein
MNARKWPQKGANSPARSAATKTVPRERLAQKRRGAEKDQEETPDMVFSAPLRLCAKKSLREGVIQPDCSAEVFVVLHCNMSKSLIFAGIPPRLTAEFLTQSRQGAKAQRVFLRLGDFAALRLCVEKALFLSA